MPRGSSPKRERQYEHIKASAKQRGESTGRAKEIAARTVNKERARSGEAKTASPTSARDMSSSQRGGQRSPPWSPVWSARSSSTSTERGLVGAEGGEFVLSGESVATVRVGGSEVPVRTAFRGWLMGFLVLDGQPIQPGVQVAWIRKA